RSAASLMVWLTRADALSTLRLKSFMVLLAIGRERAHAILRMPGSVIISCPKRPVNAGNDSQGDPTLGSSCALLGVQCGLRNGFQRFIERTDTGLAFSLTPVGLVRHARPQPALAQGPRS